MSVRKLTALLMAVIIVFTLVPFAVLAETSDEENSTVVEDTSSPEVSEPEVSEPEVSEPETSEPAVEDLTVTVFCGAGGSYTLTSTNGSRPSKHEYFYVTGDTAVLTVESDDGYVVDKVVVDGNEITAVDGEYTFTVNGNYDVAISFRAVTTYTITVECMDTDGNTVEGAYFKVNGKLFVGTTAKFEENTDFTIEFIAAPGYAIKQTRYFTGTRYMDIDNPHEDKLVENTGYLVVVEALETYKATVTAGENGSVKLNGMAVSGETVVAQGVASTIDLIPAEGYMVDTLLINGEEVKVVNNSYTFTPEADVTIEVTFKEKVDYCKITLSIGSGGGISVKDELYEIENNKYIYVPVGEVITLIFEPHINYEVNTVKVSGKTVKLNEENEYTIECTDTAATVSATFKSTEENSEATYTITAYASGGGNITPTGANEVKEGESLEFVITPNEGYEVYSVTVDGEEVALTNGKYVFENVSANSVINVTFKKAAATDTAITAEDIDWTADVISIDVSEKTKISTDIFARAADNYPTKQIVITDSEFTVIIPAASGFRPDGETVTFEFIRNGSANFAAIREAVNVEYPGANMVTMLCNAPALPAGTVIELFLGAEFAGATLMPAEYLSGAVNTLGENIDSDEKGWIKVNYSNENDLVFVEMAADKVTLTITYNTECGTVDPSGTIKVNKGETKTYTVTPNEGYEVAKITVDGEEIELNDTGVYTITMDGDHTVTVVFEAPSRVNVGLIIALVIIALCLVGGATVFVIRWRKNQF